MIFSIFLNLIFLVVNSLMGYILPTVSATGTISSSITTASSYISSLYAFIPYITITVLAILTFDLIFEGAYLIYKIVYWVIRRLPTQS